MVSADCCCRCSGAFSALLSYPFMNASRVEESQSHRGVTLTLVKKKPEKKKKTRCFLKKHLAKYNTSPEVGVTFFCNVPFRVPLRGVKVSERSDSLCNSSSENADL
ncbi:hypothetical protein ILYODFUR_023632 [Ilyodon furcidens]|uniref:Secreted protein n=1 Tax=Ilyodon furcidens TaxID=33524 RepID=A0ABV0VGI0_9TELE